jgi:hypothetical protein
MSAHLGTWPGLSLKEARAKAEGFRGKGAAAPEPTLAKVMGEWLRMKEGAVTEGSHARLSFLARRYVIPALGHLRIGDVTPALILNEVIRPLEERNFLETSHRAKSVLSRGSTYRYSSHSSHL